MNTVDSSVITPDNDKTQQDKETSSRSTTNDAFVTQTVEEITTQIKENVLKEEKKSIGKLISDFFSLQFARLGQAFIAFILAAIVAFITPFLVNLNIDEKLEGFDENFKAIANSQNTQGIMNRVASLAQTTDLINSNSVALQTSIENIELQLNELSNEPPSLQAFNRVENTILKKLNEQNELMAGIQRNLHLLQTQHMESNKGFDRDAMNKRINYYLDHGKSLELSIEKPEIDHWIGEVYFFVSLIPNTEFDLTEVKHSLKAIHNSEKPFNTEKARVDHTLVILNALRNWVDLST